MEHNNELISAMISFLCLSLSGTDHLPYEIREMVCQIKFSPRLDSPLRELCSLGLDLIPVQNPVQKNDKNASHSFTKTFQYF